MREIRADTIGGKTCPPSGAPMLSQECFSYGAATLNTRLWGSSSILFFIEDRDSYSRFGR
jgi:hypothetical protein